MLRNFLVVDEGRHKNMGRFLNELDYVLIVKFDTFRVLKDKAGLTTGDELPLIRLDTWVKEREKLDPRSTGKA